MKGYVFVSNSNKPSEKERNSKSDIKITNYSRPCLEEALALGYQVFYGVNRNNPKELKADLPIGFYDAHTYRSLTDIRSNWIAYKNMMRLLKDEDIEVIHCNTPIGGIIGRVCGRKNKVKKIIYTVHGFHFYKGAPLINRTLFKWAEQLMARWTDVIITINQEDYENANKFRLKKGGKVYKVSGVGIDTKKFEKNVSNKSVLRKQIGLATNSFVCISAGDLVANKNYLTVIKSIAKLKNENIHYLICGKGPEEKKLREAVRQLKVEKQIHFLGYRKDIPELYHIADCFLLPSIREGLSRSLMEAMASGLPCIVSEIRGNVDLIKNGKGGYLCQPLEAQQFSNAISTLYGDSGLCEKMGDNNLLCIKEYDINKVRMEIKKIYKEALEFV